MYLVFMTVIIYNEKKMTDIYDSPWWEEGHNSGGYFWIMPVRQGKDENDGAWGCYCCVEEEISIDDVIVEKYLYEKFLGPYFDSSIKYTCRDSDIDDVIQFDWYGYNLYSYDSVKKMAYEMKKYSEDDSLNKKTSEFYRTLADRLILMIERQPGWDYITFEGP